MAKSGKQDNLPLDLTGDGLASDQPMSVRITGGKSTRHLTRDQKKFSKLLQEIETLRARQQRVTTAWETFLADYLKHIHPEEQRQHELRKTVLRQLAAHLHAPKGLGPRQRDALADLIESQLAQVLNHEPELNDPELLALIEYFKGRAGRQQQDRPGAGGDDLPPFMTEIIRHAGLDPTRFHHGMTEAEFKQELERQLAENPEAFDIDPDADDFEPPPPPSRTRKGKAKSAPDPQIQARQAEEARKHTIGAIYKQLAKALHPDLETDPAKREQKHHLMQELTAAYREGDLHTLLRLELAWIHREEGDLDRLTDDKLKVYIQLLHAQADELHREINSTAYSPRFAAVSRFASPFTGEPANVGSILAGLQPYTETLEHLQTALQGPGARTELRELIRDFTRQQKAAARFPDFRAFGL